MEAKATARFVRIAPRKARRAIALIRGQHVDEARRILRFSGLGASNPVRKALDSAVAAAEQTPGVVPDKLVVARAYVDEGPTLKRWRPRALGRATRVRRRTSHITVIVESLGEVTTVGAEG
ncbi:MAG TPA: 50S ribosomal protein L22 [Actinomycetota bacterium]|nr:50S ribosomal protein L22 [Actinomycetota bacterium]